MELLEKSLPTNNVPWIWKHSIVLSCIIGNCLVLLLEVLMERIIWTCNFAQHLYTIIYYVYVHVPCDFIIVLFYPLEAHTLNSSLNFVICVLDVRFCHKVPARQTKNCIGKKTLTVRNSIFMNNSNGSSGVPTCRNYILEHITLCEQTNCCITA